GARVRSPEDVDDLSPSGKTPRPRVETRFSGSNEAIFGKWHVSGRCPRSHYRLFGKSRRLQLRRCHPGAGAPQVRPPRRSVAHRGDVGAQHQLRVAKRPALPAGRKNQKALQMPGNENETHVPIQSPSRSNTPLDTNENLTAMNKLPVLAALAGMWLASCQSDTNHSGSIDIDSAALNAISAESI